MGLDFFVGEVQAQTNEATKIANSATQAVSLLQDSVSAFLNAPLSGKTYDSAKQYFSVAYTPLRQGVILASEALIQAHQKFVSEFSSQVGGGDIQEDLLIAKIQQGNAVMSTVQGLMAKEDKFNPRLERRYENAMNSVRELEERLQKFYAFNASSASIFSDYESRLKELDIGIDAIANSSAWNPSSGTFDISKLDMTWAKRIRDKWDERAKKLKEQADLNKLSEQKKLEKEGLRLQKELDKRKYMLVDIGGTKRWMWVVDPNRITQEDFRVNEAYDLWLKKQIDLHGKNAVLGKEEPDYLTKLAIELRDGKNYDTGNPLTDLEKLQRWATIASMIAAAGIGGYYANHPITPSQVVSPRKQVLKGSKNGKNYILDKGKKPGIIKESKHGGPNKNVEPLENGPYIKNGKPNGRPKLSGNKKLEFEENVYNRQVDPDGVLRDPNTGEIIDWKPGEPRKDKVDFGHNEGNSYNNMFEDYKNGKITLDELKEFQFNPDNYRLEKPSSNRSHKYE